MDRNIVDAVRRLHGQGALSDAQAAFFTRVGRGELVSVRWEIQIALWAGVTLIATGAGLLVKERLAELGPLAISLGLGFATAICLWYVAKQAPAFSPEPVPSPTLAFDYVLLLGGLLFASTLAYAESQFKMLGPNWPWHLLAVALVQFALAYRYDSRSLLSLGLASFAAWRGVALSFAAGAFIQTHSAAIRVNALAVGALFIAAGIATQRQGMKAHFEPVWTNLGLALLLGAAVSGVYVDHDAEALPWAVLLATLSPAAIWLATRTRRSGWFAIAVIAAYLGLLRAIAELHLFRLAGGLFLVAFTSLAVLGLIIWTHRSWREDD